MNIEGLISQLGVLFLITFIGWVGYKSKILPENTNKVLSGLVINISNPCTVLASVMTGTRALSNREVWIMTAIAVGFHVVMIVFGWGLTRVMGTKGQERKLYQYMTVFCNNGFVGIPVIAAMLGPESVFPVAIFVLVFQLFCFTYGVSLFPKGTFNWKALISPMIVCTLLAYAIYMLDLPVPGVVSKTADMMGAVTSPAAMLALGCALAAVPFKNVIRQWKLMIFSFIRLTVGPILVWALCFFWLKNELMLGVAVAIGAMPAAVNTTLLATRYGGDEELAASGVFISTLMCIGTMPLVMGLLFR